MTDWARATLKPGQIFAQADAVRWFAQHYPKIKHSTINMHVEVMSINNRLRRHYPSIKLGSGHDLFFKTCSLLVLEFGTLPAKNFCVYARSMGTIRSGSR
jgi:endonuclease